MDEPLRSSGWIYWLLYTALGVILIFFSLLPINVLSNGGPLPDFMMVVAFAWASRRPDYMPIFLLAGLLLLMDFLLNRPPGLWTALVVIGAEILRTRTGKTKEVPFLLEWVIAASTIFAVFIIYRIVLMVALVPIQPLVMDAMTATLTVAAYPLVVLISAVVFGVHKTAPGTVDRKGQPI